MQKIQNFLWVTLISLIILSGCKGPDGPGDLISLSKISGDWIRVESNNPGSDFMKIEVSGSTGIITDKAGSGFQDGDTKWQSITPVDLTTFSYQELGSDYNYYEATITLVNDNELRISVGNSGAGNSQKWLRDDGSIVNVAATILDCNFTDDEVLVNTAAAVDYIVPCVVDITAAISIEPGVVIEFEENAGFGVYDGGSLKMAGTSTDPIILRGENSSAGYWRGIHIETNSLNNQMDYVTIEDAGSNYVYCCNEVASVFLKGGKLSMKNTSIANGGGLGFYANKAASIAEFSNNTITTHEDAPAKIHLERAGELDGTGSDFTGNDDDYVVIMQSSVSDETEVPALNVPYLFEGKVMDITNAMTVKAGAELVFEENGGIGVYDGGSLNLEGSSGNPVVLRGKEANRGYWRGVHIETNSSNNKFSYAQISDAGSNYVYCCNEKASVFLKGGKLSIENTTISNGENYGVYADKDAEFATYISNTVTTHGKSPLYLAAERAGELDGTESDYTGNDDDYVGIFNSNIANATTWGKNNVPYLIGGFVVDITEPLTIERGAEIAFAENGGLGVYDGGTLNAVGTSSAKIIFRGQENTNGYWRGIHTETNSNSNQITHAEIRNAGSNYVYCCNDKGGLLVKDGKMKVTKTLFQDNDGCGIIVKAAATLEESGNSFVNNPGGDICS